MGPFRNRSIMPWRETPLQIVAGMGRTLARRAARELTRDMRVTKFEHATLTLLEAGRTVVVDPGSLTTPLADLEEPGAKNVLREKLVTAYNQALGHRVADQVYFSDFVVQ